VITGVILSMSVTLVLQVLTPYLPFTVSVTGVCAVPVRSVGLIVVVVGSELPFLLIWHTVTGAWHKWFASRVKSAAHTALGLLVAVLVVRVPAGPARTVSAKYAKKQRRADEGNFIAWDFAVTNRKVGDSWTY